MKPITRYRNQSSTCLEALERRLFMDGNLKVAMSGGDLIVSGDQQDNVVVISRPAAGKIRVAGMEDTTVNGGSFKDFSAAFDDLKIRMRQGGEDQVAVQGALSIAGDLNAELGNGEIVIEGSAGPLVIGEHLNVRGGAECDVKLRNEVIVKGNTTIRTGGEASAAANLGIVPDFKSARFSHSLEIDNPYFPLLPGMKYVYEEKSVDDETGDTVTETIVVEVTNQTKTILGVKNRVLRDRVYVDGLLVEDTFDWHSQDDNGNVWYFGERSTDFEYDDDGNLIDTSTATSWQAGVNGAKPGIIMMARPRAGDRYYQELQPGVALDQGEVLATNQTVKVPVGTFSKVLRTKDTSVLSPDQLENKFYAPGLGLIQELTYDIQSGEVEATLRLISAKLNGKPVTNVVPSSGFAGINATGKGTGPVQMFGETVIRAGGPVVLKQTRLGDEIEIFSNSQVTVLDSHLDDLSIEAEDSVGLSNVTADEEVLIRGDVDVYVLNSKFNGEVEILLGSGDNELVVKNSSFDELEADGGRGEDTFEDLGGNRFDKLKLTSFEDR